MLGRTRGDRRSRPDAPIVFGHSIGAPIAALYRGSRRILDERASAELVVGYQADILGHSLDAIVWRRDEGPGRLRAAGTPFVSLYTAEVDPHERSFLAERLLQAEIEVRPVGHHFPHVSDPDRFARLLGAR